MKKRVLTKCRKCGVELDWREWIGGDDLCFICRGDKQRKEGE